MRGLSLSIPVVLIISAAAMAQSSGGAPDDEAAIRDLEKRATDAWNRGDAKACAELFVADGDVCDPLGQYTRGRIALENLYRRHLGDNGPQSQPSHTNKIRTIRFLCADIAIVDGEWEMVAGKTKDIQEAHTHGYFTDVVVKKDGRWHLAAIRSMVPVLGPGGKTSRGNGK